jgi:hypothetical protein
MLKTGEKDTANLQLVLKHLEDLHTVATVTSFGTRAQSQLRELFEISEYARQHLSLQRILKSLAFEGMHGRFGEVLEAHKKTFQWMLSENAAGNGYNERSSARDLFIDWLSGGSGIFHISGKLGSGKSTLMKFLCGESRTTTELQKWAGMLLFHDL